jgi:hypothetical protein
MLLMHKFNSIFFGGMGGGGQDKRNKSIVKKETRVNKKVAKMGKF